MIFVTGDTHTEWNKRFSTAKFPKQKELTKEDLVIVCGDFGIWDGSKRENYWMDWLEAKPFSTLFVAGNHENYDILDALPKKEWKGGLVNEIRPSVLHLTRGQVFLLQGKTFFTFGGAGSHDMPAGILEPSDPEFKRKRKRLDRRRALYRVHHESWWARELPSEEEMAQGWKSLKRCQNRVDYIITHTPYTNLLPVLEDGTKGFQADRLSDYLQEIHDQVDFGAWYFGHVHRSWQSASGREYCVHEEIVRLL